MSQTTLKANEASKRSGFFSKSYGLSISVTIDAQHPLDQEIRHVNECFVKWLRNRGKQCGDLVFVFEAPAEVHAHIRELVGKILDQPLAMDGVISRLDIMLGLINPTTGKLTKVKINWKPSA